MLFNVWGLDTNCISEQTCFWNDVIVLFPCRENAFSYPCEVKNNFGSEKLAREQVLTFHVLYLKSPRSDASLLGLGQRNLFPRTIHFNHSDKGLNVNFRS